MDADLDDEVVWALYRGIAIGVLLAVAFYLLAPPRRRSRVSCARCGEEIHGGEPVGLLHKRCTPPPCINAGPAVDPWTAAAYARSVRTPAEHEAAIDAILRDNRPRGRVVRKGKSERVSEAAGPRRE